MKETKSMLPQILKTFEAEILADWMKEQQAAIGRRSDLISEGELKKDSAAFLRLVQMASQSGNLADITAPEWKETTDFLVALSRTRATAGFSPTETAQFIFSLKSPVLRRLANEKKGELSLMDEVFTANELLDKLGLFTAESYQKTRDEIIRRQQEDMLELSTPVVKLWDGVLALPMIGTLDSSRTQVVMETLLQRIVETGSEIAIIDITGVPHVDTLTAQYLLKTVTAARLMGADCIISGIRPQIAQTIVHLGVDLGSVTTKASLADAFKIALARMGRKLGSRGQEASSQAGPSMDTQPSRSYGTFRAPAPQLNS